MNSIKTFCNIVNTMIFLFFIVSSDDVDAKDNPNKILPILTIDKVLIIAQKYTSVQKIDLVGYKIVSVSYERDQNSWYVFYRSNSLSFGKGMFGLVVDDVNPHNIRPIYDM